MVIKKVVRRFSSTEVFVQEYLFRCLLHKVILLQFKKKCILKFTRNVTIKSHESHKMFTLSTIYTLLKSLDHVTFFLL